MNNRLNHEYSNAIKSGMAVERNGELMVTESGLFALSCIESFADDTAEDRRAALITGIDTALKAARHNGLSDFSASVVIQAFSSGFSPMDQTAEGRDLARLCNSISRYVGAGKMRFCLEGNSRGNQTH